MLWICIIPLLHITFILCQQCLVLECSEDIICREQVRANSVEIWTEIYSIYHHCFNSILSHWYVEYAFYEASCLPLGLNMKSIPIQTSSFKRLRADSFLTSISKSVAPCQSNSDLWQTLLSVTLFLLFLFCWNLMPYWVMVQWLVSAWNSAPNSSCP